MKCIMLSALLAATALACSNTLAPYQPEIANVNDSFQFQITGTQNLSTKREYTWHNTAPTASVNQSASISSGTAMLTIYDAGGTPVYNRSLADNGTYQTSTGSAGDWKILVVFTNLNATVNFRVQALTP